MSEEGQYPLRDRVFTRVEALLNQPGDAGRVKLGWLDRPIFIALIGALIASLGTAWFSSCQNRKNLQLQYSRQLFLRRASVIREFSVSSFKDENIVSDWLLRLEWMSDLKGSYRGKPFDKAAKKSWDTWADQVDALKAKYNESPPIDSLLINVTLFFRSQAVLKDCAELSDTWNKFETLANNASHDFTRNQTLSDESRKAIDHRRPELFHDLDLLTANLAKDAAQVMAPPD